MTFRQIRSNEAASSSGRPRWLTFTRSIGGQLAILLVVSLLLIHLIAVLWLFGVDRDTRPAAPDALLQRQVAAVWLLDRTAPEEREALLAELSKSDPDLVLTPLPTPIEGLDWTARDKPPLLRDGIASGIETAMLVSPDADGDEPAGIAFRLNDGAMLIAKSDRGQPPFFAGPVVTTIVFLVVSLVVLGFWAARSLTAPLRLFSSAVERFGADDMEPVELAERGPDELRRAARAFNHMQQRINRLVDDRTRMLAAVGHDLRTPITRLRLRAEYIEDTALCDAMLADLNHMDALLQGALIYLRDGRNGEKTTSVDLASLLQTVSDQRADAGEDVPYAGSVRVSVQGRPSELLRLFGNLVDNAVKHGGGGEIRLAVEEDCACVDIIDHGPGIPAGSKDEMLVAFARGDAARNMDEASGFGLGLAICTAIAKGHDGRLELLDTPGGGLTVRVELPLA